MASPFFVEEETVVFFFLTGRDLFVLATVGFALGFAAGRGAGAGWASDFLKGFSFFRLDLMEVRGPAGAGGGAARARQKRAVVQAAGENGNFMGGNQGGRVLQDGRMPRPSVVSFIIRVPQFSFQTFTCPIRWH